MEEELIPNELRGSLILFESLFCMREPQNLRLLAMEGHLQSIQNRFLCWRAFLGLLPETGPIEEWVEVAERFRKDYKEIVRKHTVKDIQNMKVDNLDPLIFNPLSSAAEVYCK